MKVKLKEILMGKEFKAEEYNEELKKIVKKVQVEANTTDFDVDRLYKAGYEGKDDWKSDYVASIEVEFMTNENGQEYVKIVDVY